LLSVLFLLSTVTSSFEVFDLDISLLEYSSSLSIDLSDYSARDLESVSLALIFIVSVDGSG